MSKKKESTVSLTQMGEEAGGLVQWVTDEGKQAVIRDDVAIARRGMGRFKQDAFFIRAVDAITGDAMFLKVTKGTAAKIGIHFKKYGVFLIQRMETAAGKVRYSVKLDHVVADEGAIAEVDEALDNTDLSEAALDKALEQIES